MSNTDEPVDESPAQARERLREEWMRAGAPGVFYEWLVDRLDRALIEAKKHEPKKPWRRRMGHRRT
jgi:hypothetical protein